MRALQLVLLLTAAVEATAQERVPARPLAGNPMPAYPDDAREKEVEGYVGFKASVDEQGFVRSVDIVSVPGPGLGFDTAVTEAVRRWRFDPARLEGRPVDDVYVSRLPLMVSIPAWRARMFPVSSRTAWETMLRVLQEASLPTYTVDRPHQFVLTRSVTVARRDLPPLELPERYRPDAFSLHVFVSPFAEPARVYVGATLDAYDQLVPKYARRYQDVRILQKWLLDLLEQALRTDGHAIPLFERRRKELARRLLGPSAAGNPCLELQGSRPPSGQITPAEPIKAAHVGPLYPAAEGFSGGRVRVEARLLEDGAVGDVRVLESTAPSAEYVTAVVEATRLARFQPARAHGCPVSGPMQYTVNFKGPR